MQLVKLWRSRCLSYRYPQITFWKVTYRRHTNFAMESIEQTFNGQVILEDVYNVLSLETVILLEHICKLHFQNVVVTILTLDG